MKNLLLILLISFTGVAQAQHHHGHGYGHSYGQRHGGYGYSWVAPAIIGGIVTYELTRPAPVVIQQQPVVIQPQAPYGYHYENILDANCNCYRLVLVQN